MVRGIKNRSATVIERATTEKEIAAATIEQLEDTNVEYEQLTKDIFEKSEQLEQQRLDLEAEKIDLLDQQEKIKKERDELNIELSSLEAQKTELEKSKEIYSTGLFASLGALFIGVMGFMSRRPLVKLEMRLKELEIAEKEKQLAEIS